ncbi:MAG: DUF4214 domain-containing protein, partial [Pyrinomonadaceae bacterium]
VRGMVIVCLSFIALLAMLVPSFNRVGGKGQSSGAQPEQNSQSVSSSTGGGASSRTIKSSGRRSQGNRKNEANVPEPAKISSLMNAAHGDMSKSLSQSAAVNAQGQSSGGPESVQLIGPVSLDRDLRTLPDIPQTEHEDEQRLMRYPPSEIQGQSVGDDPMLPVRAPAQPIFMPTPTQTFPGITSVQSACGCLPPDTDGDVGPNHYIQDVNSRFKIINKTGTQLVAPTTYNSLFSALGPTTPCGNNQNGGDAIVLYDHMANRWVISDFAFPAFPGVSFYQCIAVSKTADPVAGGWWLYALQVDPSNPTFLGDYPKFGVWPDAYYLSVNLFSNNTTFNGVRVYALPRSAMVNGTGAPNPGAIAFTITPANLGDKYSLVPATFRNGISPVTGGTTVTPEYFMAINSSATAGTVENQVFTWRFHADFVTPANSTFGVGAGHTPDGTTTVTNFVDAFTSAGTAIVPQNGTTRLLDTLGDKLMYPLVYQNLGGVESIYASHTINNNQGGTGPTAIRWYQLNVTGSTIPATPTQQQTFNNAADGLWRFMPSLAVDGAGNLAIGYAESSSTTEPAIAYAGRLLADPPNTLAQGEAILQAGGGHQTSASGRWGDYSATHIDPTDNCSFWHTNEYYSATSGSAWNTRIGTFKFPTCLAPTAATSTIRGQVLTPDGSPLAGVTVSMSGMHSARTITDSNGNYRFLNVETNGFYTLTPETIGYTFSPGNLSFSLFGDKTDALFTASPEAVATINPLDTDLYFVRQQYLDFLGREPDQGGLDYWANEISQCGGDRQCINSRRIEISAAFFVEQEFQRTGSFVYRLYKAGLGRQLSYAEFSMDRSRVVGGANLEQDKADFARDFVERPEFAQKYGSATTAESFVDALIQAIGQSAGADLSAERESLIAKYRTGSNMIEGRSLAIMEAIENDAFKQAMYNPSFVRMQYFGYLHRDPDEGGEAFWLNVLNNREPNNYHGMVCSFVTSAEYQKRFSSVVTHSNSECR